MKMSCLFSVAGALVLAIGLSGVFAEEPTTSPKKVIESFVGARDQRAKLLPEIQQLKTEIEELQHQKENVSRLKVDKRSIESNIRQAEQDLARAQQEVEAAAPEAKEGPQAYVRRIEDYLKKQRHSLEDIDRELAEANEGAKKMDEEIGKNQAVLTQRQADFNAAEYRINELLNFELPRQKFKLLMSATFAALVGLVIIGFFYIAWGDERVRQAIFSGTAGIQFVTLFSLVIAIILFGIIEILEGKELAALLGGLSGYILGRATSEHTSAQPEQPSRDQRAPLGTQPQSPVQAPPALQPSVGNGAAQHAQP
jgi:hypothetical protein